MVKKVDPIKDFEKAPGASRDVEPDHVPLEQAEKLRRSRRRRRERIRNRLPGRRAKQEKSSNKSAIGRQFIGRPSNDPCDDYADWPVTAQEYSQMLFDGQSTGEYCLPPRDERKWSPTLNKTLCHHCRRYVAYTLRVVIEMFGEKLPERWCADCIENRDELEMEREIRKQVKRQLRSGAATEF